MRRTLSFWLVLILVGFGVPLSAQEAESGASAGGAVEGTEAAERQETAAGPEAAETEASAGETATEPEAAETATGETVQEPAPAENAPAEEPAGEPEEEQPEIEWDTYVPDLYRAGDKTFGVTVGLMIPAVFTGSGMEGGDSNIFGLGGTGTLSYTHFLSPNWFLGGELQGMFAGTRGGNMLYIVPFGVHFGYQFVLGRFEFPIKIMTGAAPTRYLELGHFGWIIKPGISGFYRYDADWSFGLNFNWWMMPQWPANGKFVFGNFMEISFTARYHF